MTTIELLAVAAAGDMSPACFLLVLVPIAAAVVLLVLWNWHAKVRSDLEQVARQLEGIVVWLGDWLFHLPQVRFHHHGLPAEIRFSKRGENSHYTHVQIDWSGPALRCEIFPEDFLAGLRKLMGMRDIVVGSPPFDQAFLITGDDEPGIKALLGPAVREAVFELARITSGIHIRIGSRSLTVTTRGLISDPPRLLELVHYCCRLCDAVIAGLGEGIEFVEGGQVQPRPLAQSRCMVCGEALAADVVFCKSCKTPHHRECWSYSGGCSTYGCGGRKYATTA